MSEKHLFVIWPKARFAEARILEDLAKETRIVFKTELEFEGDAALAYRRFYGPKLPDEKRKVRNCGSGPFLLVVVEDCNPDYRTIDTGSRKPMFCNARMWKLKTRYRKWSGRKHRVHGTVTKDEFAIDVEMLTGHPAAEWEPGVPAGPVSPKLPEGWEAISSTGPLKTAPVRPAFRPLPIPALGNVILRDKYINDFFTAGRYLGMDAIEKHSTKAVASIGNEYKIASRMYAAAPDLVPAPLAWLYAKDGRSASFIAERIGGTTLSEALKRGLAESEADRFADDMCDLADALEKTGIVHRDLFADNFIVPADGGRLKTIDWQLAIERDGYREDPWVAKNWKFRYVVFGVNRDLGLGRWNDFAAMANILKSFPRTAKVDAAIAKLEAKAPSMTFSAPPSRGERTKLMLYAISLRFQMLLKRRDSEKYARLKRRFDTIWRKGKM